MQTSKKAPVPVSLEQSFALCEINYALTDGIFEPTRKIRNPHLHLREVIRKTKLAWNDEETGKRIEQPVTLTFHAPYALNPQAESILLAIIKLSGINGIKAEPDQPRLPLFNIEGDAALRATGKVICTQYQLLKEADMGTGKRDYDLLEYYLEQMAKVSMKWKNHTTGWRGMSHLIGYAMHEDNSLVVQLNWRLAGAIFGDYERAVIDLRERHTLRKDPSKTLHRWLSAHLWKGKSEYITHEKLASHIWTQEATKKTLQKRTERLRNEILPELASLPNWIVKADGKGAHITHLRDPK
jgi:hypothetical protein